MIFATFFPRRRDGHAAPLPPVSGDTTCEAAAGALPNAPAAARALAQIGIEKRASEARDDRARYRAKYRAKARELCALRGLPVSAALEG